MADEIYLNVPEAERVAKELASNASTFKEAVETMKAALQREHGCWSDDEIGKGFEANYLQTANETQQALTTLADTMVSLGKDAIPGAINNVQQLDSEYGEVVSSYANQLNEFNPRSS